MPDRLEQAQVLIVLPALNEGPSVGAVVRVVKDRYPGYDVLMVDDGSTDDTAARALAAGEIVCSLPFNLGVGGAIERRTVRPPAGLRGGIQVDADGPHDPSYIQ